MKNYGKKFEEDFLKSIPDDYFIHRIKDSSPVAVNGIIKKLKNNINICDFILFNGSKLYLLELKSVKDKSMPFTNIDKSPEEQLKKISKLYENSIKKNINAGFIINFRLIEKTYYIPIDKFLDFYSNTEKKSINNIECELIGKLIPCRIKRTRYNYFIDFK